jgi:hypothetical protein
LAWAGGGLQGCRYLRHGHVGVQGLGWRGCAGLHLQRVEERQRIDVAGGKRVPVSHGQVHAGAEQAAQHRVEERALRGADAGQARAGSDAGAGHAGRAGGGRCHQQEQQRGGHGGQQRRRQQARAT